MKRICLSVFAAMIATNGCQTQDFSPVPWHDVESYTAPQVATDDTTGRPARVRSISSQPDSP